MTSNAERSGILVRALQARTDGNRAALSAVYTDDVRAWTPSTSVSSLAELLAEFDRADDAFSDLSLEVHPLDVGGAFACVEWRLSMTHVGALVVGTGQVLDPTGLRITVSGTTVAEFRGDRICSLRQYWDELSAFDQLGLVPGEAQA